MDSAAYITFCLGQDVYAIPVQQVREVLDLEPITPLPMVPPYLKGIINVRGSAIPVVDLRAKFGMSPCVPSLSSRILVLEFHMGEQDFLIGGLADAVEEVIEITPSLLAPAPRVGLRMDSGIIEAITMRDGKFVMLLSLAKAFQDQEIRSIGETAQAPVAERLP